MPLVRAEGDSCLLSPPPPPPRVLYGEISVLHSGQMQGHTFFSALPSNCVA